MPTRRMGVWGQWCRTSGYHCGNRGSDSVQASETLMPGGEGPYSAQSRPQLLRLFFPLTHGVLPVPQGDRSFSGLAANKDTHPGRLETAHSFSVSTHGQL